MKRIFIILPFALGTCPLSFSVLSQEHHYWTNQFGSRSALLSGAVVGSVKDTSAVFYNPGGLGFLKESSFSVSANGYRLDRMTVDNGAGTGNELESQSPQVVPLLVSGTFQLGDNTLGYSLITKNLSSLSMSDRLVFKEDFFVYASPSADEIRPFDGYEEYRGQFLFDSKVSEIWGGISLARKLKNNVSVGVSGFLALRDQKLNYSTLARVANIENVTSDSIAMENRFQTTDFYNVRMLMKFGVLMDLNPIKLGATLTSPSVNLYGKGTVGAGITVINPVNEKAFIADDRQEDLKTDYKTPFSLALGIEYAVTEQTRFAGTIEWFAQQNRYTVMSPNSREMFLGTPGENRLGKVGDSQDLLRVEDMAESVVNFGVGVEHVFSEQYKGYLSYRTDFETSSNEAQNYQLMGINNWDIFHLTVGMTRTKQDSELAVGLTYSFGNQDDFEPLVNLDIRDKAHLTENDILIPSEHKTTSADYRSLGLTVGYTYFFK
jgi:long-subunit fatty acid transport protein